MSSKADELETQARDAALRGDVLGAIALARQAIELDAAKLGLLDELAHTYARGTPLGQVSLRRVPVEASGAADPPAAAARAAAASAASASGAPASAGPGSESPPPATSAAPPVVSTDVDVPLFSSLTEQAFSSLAQQMAVFQATAGQPIVEQGDPGNCMFIIVEGRAAVHRGAQRLAILSDGDFFGELSVLAQKPRAASVTTVEDCKLFRLDRDLLMRVAAHFPGVLEVAKAFARRRLASTALASSDVFSELSERSRDELAGRFELSSVAPGTEILAEGAPSSGLYVVLAGKVEVHVGDEKVAELGEGEVVGEISTLFGTATTASVRAGDETVLLHLPPSALDEVLADQPGVRDALTEIGQERWALV